MKNYYRWTSILVPALLLCVVNAPVLGQKAGGLYISISQTRTEHSRDSYSISKTITINGNALLYEESGRRSKQVHKEYKLTDQEIIRLRQLISEKNLLISRSIEYPEATGPHTSFVLSLELKSNRKRSLIRISGSLNSKELDSDRVYKNANAFLEQITEMIYSKDESKPR
ncbi:MAG TPA: hypothetical protein VHE60_01540 [Pyrinomonadaceae bacterium]|nr:hypothetical protein [Pyrinomonadaceae bacterium]